MNLAEISPAKMSPERWRAIKPLLERALELKAEDRRAFLDLACAGDEALRREVDSFIAAHEQAGDFMDKPAFEEAARMPAEEQSPRKTLALDRVATDERSHGATTLIDGGQNFMLESGAILDERYLIERELGQGGIGQVFLARNLKLPGGAQVVIKVLREQTLEREDRDWFEKKFRAEIEALSRINHPGVVSALDAGQLPDGRAYFVMQYVPGVTLRSVMTPGGMDPKRAADLLRKIAQPLDAAHEQGVIHRDLKPANIMLQLAGPEEYVKIIDFGIATVLGTATATPKQTRAIGTLPYTAPEQLQGRPIAASDIFALGVIAFEMVTGELPFNADSSAQQIELQRAGAVEKLREMRAGLPEAARAAILKAMAFDPSNRYSAAREFSEAFDRALAEPGQRNPVRTPPRDPEPHPAQRGPAQRRNDGQPRSEQAAPALPGAPRQAQRRNDGSPPPAFRTPQVAPAIRQPTARSPLWAPLIVVSIALLAAAAVGTIVWLRMRPIDWSRLSRLSDRTSPTPPAKPPASPELGLSYSLLALRNPKRNPGGQPFTTHGAIIFKEGDQVRLNVSTAQAGYLYVINEGPELAGGPPEFVVMYPNAGGSAQVEGDQTIQIPAPSGNPETDWFVFNEEVGVEKIWLIWSERSVAEMEEIKRWANPKDKGLVGDPSQVERVAQYLKALAAAEVEVEMDAASQRTKLKGKGEVLASVVRLEHR
jgi:serine/threonine protein kinase